MTFNLKLIISFILGVLFSYGIIWVILKTSIVYLFADKPGPRRINQRQIPRVGGIAILLGFQVLVYAWHLFIPSVSHLPSDLLSALTFAALAIMLVGLADDMVVFHIHNKAKFLLEVLIAVEIVFINGIQLREIHLLGWDWELGYLSIPITVLWIVGVTNAINIIDGVDGLAGSVTAVIFATLAIFTGFSSNNAVLFLCVIMAGLVIGFLMHNKTPARVFLGDTGSLFLGIIIGVLSIYLVSNSSGSYPILIAPLLVGLPLLDVFTAMFRRFMKKILAGTNFMKALGAMSVADNEHMHHRLVYRGLTHSETVIILVLFHSVICMGAIMVKFTSKEQCILMLIYISVLGVWFLYKLQFFERFEKLFKKVQVVQNTRRFDIAVVDSSDVLAYSLQKYQQDLFAFTFFNEDEIVHNERSFAAIILEQQQDMRVDKVISLARSLFSQYSCPIIVVSELGQIPPNFQFQDAEQSTFMMLKKPIYIPMLLRELLRLIRLSRSWSMERVTEDTRQFLMQAVINEDV
ncbi:MAG: undecaprenyl/decaprenyl-phosphate alpha-N-acetylglucosaminyl 1-phosphate transferase [Fibrobacter sp.]|nr:undecaprenyl/decaprenyl-phosphate alpha-N-acetylglucosaminyl 1-phosphate transferase [Fibrobacter sp.]